MADAAAQASWNGSKHPESADVPFVPTWNGWTDAPDAAQGNSAQARGRERKPGAREARRRGV